MEENKESPRDWIVQLGDIVESIDKSFISNGCKIFVELDENQFRFLQKNFREIDMVNQEIIVMIDNTQFTFSLKK